MAAGAALNSLNKVLIENHLKTCVKDDILNGKDESMDELIAMVHMLMK